MGLHPGLPKREGTGVDALIYEKSHLTEGENKFAEYDSNYLYTNIIPKLF